MFQKSLQTIGQLTGLTLLSVLFGANVLAQNSDAFPSVEALSQPAAPAKSLETVPKDNRIGIQFQGAPILNEGKLLFLTGIRADTNTQTPGRCLGSFYIPPTQVTTMTPYKTQVGAQAWFVSRTTPPASGLRVTLQNRTPGVDQTTIPYTDRDYAQPDRSELFTVKQDVIHSSRHLTVRPGINSFVYQIKRGSQIVESGSFTVLVETEVKADPRPEYSEPLFPALNEVSNHCAPPESAHSKAAEIETLKLPELPALPPDVQKLLDESKK